MENGDLKNVYTSLCQKDLAGAVSAMEIYLSKHRSEADQDRLFAIRSDFQLMTDYWKRGFKDPQLPALYMTLLRRMYGLYAQVALNNEVGQSTFLSSVYTRLHISARDWSFPALRDALETFVSDVAMLELEQAHVRGDKAKTLYERHHQMMSEWFDRLWLSAVWTDPQASAMEEILLSPTIESRDQQLMVSAMSMALLRSYDSAKFRTLLHVYRQTADVYVRQRALVGWTMALKHEVISQLYTEDIQEVEKLLEDRAVCQELVQLQHQIYFCINAEKDNRTIQQEIMPDLLQGSRLKVTRDGIEEMDEDTLNDILHPDEEERRMEQMEESYQRMQTMQKQGSDIYFGGFSQMKRYPFFQEAVNWFVPFYPEHPGITDIMKEMRKNRFLSGLMNIGPFCNSDKYSFVLAFSQVIVRIPQQMRELLEKSEIPMSEVIVENKEDAVFVRRTYLQDLYRFYRLYPYRSEFPNPFEFVSRLFFANKIFRHTHLEPYFNDIAAFLIKQKRDKEAYLVLLNCGEARRDFRSYMMAGYLMSKYSDLCAYSDEGAVGCYQQALQLKPDNEKALQGYARALFNGEQYLSALEIYDKLLELQPDSKNILLNRAVCLTRLARYQDAQKDLFRLNYEQPEDRQVIRVLAWTLTCDEKYEQAIKLYSQLMTDEVKPEDLLNYGYCLWLNGQVGDAADCFHRYLKETDAEPSVILQNERELLLKKGITEPEMQMMLYLL